MRIRPPDLDKCLQRGLVPIYLLSGDEPLQMNEVADTIRGYARSQGYLEREILEANNRFDWNSLTAEANNLSLFAQQRIIELRMPNGKPGKEGAKALTEYAKRPPQDTLLLITMPKFERSQGNSKWVTSLEKSGALIQIWPIKSNELQSWIEKRMRKNGLIPKEDVASILADHIEGNLLAAAQEIDKLLLLHGPGAISMEQLTASVSDSARYDVYGLVDSALEGKVAHCVRMLNGLRAEGTPAPVVLWALTREMRMLYSLAIEVDKGRSPQQAIASRREIWKTRHPLISRSLQRLRTPHCRQLLQMCGETDLAIKGQRKLDPWLLLQKIATRMAGAPSI